MNYKWTPSPAGCFPHIGHDHSTVDNTGTNNVVFTLLAVFSLCPLADPSYAVSIALQSALFLWNTKRRQNQHAVDSVEWRAMALLLCIAVVPGKGT